MCGIFCSLSRDQYIVPTDEEFALLKRRGPDSCRMVHRQIPNKLDKAPLYFTFCATVLTLRGDQTTEQPLEDPSSQSLFCWNGEAWKSTGESIDGNDAQFLFSLLTNASEESSTAPEPVEASSRSVARVLGSISGPFAFLYFDARHLQLFFGRDILGRRSLLKAIPGDGCLLISSVSGKSSVSTWTEVEADGVYAIDLTRMLKSNRPRDCTAGSGDVAYAIERTPWSYHERTDSSITTLGKYSPLRYFNRETPTAEASQLRLDSPAVNGVYDQLTCSLALRLHNIPMPPSVDTNPTRIGILFSGGLDCALLARICHEVLPLDHDIDLLNVAFENPRVVKAASKTSSGSSSTYRSAYSMCPDRVTGISTHAELREVCPGRTWRFMSIDVPYVETLAHRSKITALIYPHDTEMDLSIACALYFAARGTGTVKDGHTGIISSYTTPARILLSGLGADEIFAGYTRHSTAFERSGFEGLLTELELDVSRLGKRNLGRDDRVISHWGKEARYPYLDEAFVDWALGLPVWEKCGFRRSKDSSYHPPKAEYPILEPAKLPLRLLLWRLGMKAAASEKKRAIQFGARTAKMEAGKTKGTQFLTSTG